MMDWKKLENKRKKYINRYYRLFRKALNKQLDSIVEYLELSNNYESLLGNIDSLIKEDGIKETFLKLYGDVGSDFGLGVGKMIKKNTDFEETAWIEEMKFWALHEAGFKINSINNYSRSYARKLIQQQIEQGIDKGLGIAEITANIKKKLPLEWKKGNTWRARRIAQTEVIGASNMASLKGAERFGVKYKVWLTAPAGIAKEERHNRVGVNGQKRQLHEAFDVDGEPLQYPGDPSGSAANIINCRCTQFYEMED